VKAMRRSRRDIEKRREAKSSRFFLTGGTGFLGSHIAIELLKRGYRVWLLARSGNHQPAEARVQKLLDWHGLDPEGRRQLRIIVGDITRPGLGIEPGAVREVLQNTDEIIHCASNTSFSERKRAEVEAVNRDGMSNILDFARASGADSFHHISTAFVAGKRTGSCLEEPVTTGEFFNAYEETKCRGEQIAAAACREAGLGLTIYRPSIVYGDSRTGRSLLFNAVYFPVRAALILKDLFEKDIRERGGKKAQEMGVHIEADGTTHLPLRIETVPRGGINLVPVNFFTDAFLALMEEAPGGGIFHIVNGRTTRLEDLIEYGCRLFRMTGIRAGRPEEFRQVPRNPLESLYDHYIEAYGSYMRDTRAFDTAKSRSILERKGIACPEFNYDIFARCMTFAVAAGFGSQLFAK
jgi:nucleoside-diphosphate-sugar epimerase